MVHRIVYFSPTVALTLDEKGEAVKVEWDWADSYDFTHIDLEDSLEEWFEDSDGCAVMDNLIIDNNELMRWV